MKQKVFLSVLSGALSAMMCLSMAVLPVHAEEIATYHEKKATETEAEDAWYAVARWTNMAAGIGKIKQAGKAKVTISGSTDALHVCDTLKLALYLDESSDNKSYGTIGVYHYQSNNDVSVSGGEAGISVTSDYYYRLRGVHSVTHQGKTETTDSNTDAIKAL